MAFLTWQIERQIFDYLAEGRPAIWIACQLGVSKQSVTWRIRHGPLFDEHGRRYSEADADSDPTPEQIEAACAEYRKKRMEDRKASNLTPHPSPPGIRVIPVSEIIFRY